MDIFAVDDIGRFLQDRRNQQGEGKGEKFTHYLLHDSSSHGDDIEMTQHGSLGVTYSKHKSNTSPKKRLE